MSEADNRDASNLLLLCLFHAWEVDDIPEQYPADVLRAWKRAQLAEYERARKGWPITEDEAREAVAPIDLRQVIDAITGVVPFNPRMRNRIETWQLAVRKGRGRRVARLTPLVSPARREAVLAWMAALDDPVIEVPAGEVRVLVARLGAGKSEQAARWWEQGLQAAANDPDTEIPLYFTPRAIVSSLEQAVVTELGGDPTRTCRVVIDDLNEVSEQKAAGLLTEARQLVQVWPKVSVLATARPGIAVPAEEKIDVDPWPVARGADLAEVAIGDHVPPHLWTTETADLLTSPLTTLVLAARVHAGRDPKVSRAQLLSELASTVIQSHHIDVSDETLDDLARLAVALLERPESATVALFRLPRLSRLVGTDLVVLDDGRLTFALPVFEQYFGAEAIRSGLKSLEAVAAAGSFPRWRYALAFAVSGATAPEQEALLVRLARINPAAAFWVLDEFAGTEAHETLGGPSDEVIAALIRHRDPSGATTAPDLAIRAGSWLREAEQALLNGLGPLAESLVRHRDGKLVQWGVRLHNGYLTLARAREATPPPDVVKLAEVHPSLTDGWHRWTQFRFPTTDFGRWLLAQQELQEQLQTTIKGRTLPVPRTSWLARERTYHLASVVQDFGSGRRRRPIYLAELRDTVAAWMERANASQRSTWRSTTRHTVDSDDIRWLSTRLALEDGDTLEPPWPDGDQQRADRWSWQRYSPELTLTLATAIVREALIGYRQLVELNFPAFGDAMGLYSMLPLRVAGLVSRFVDDEFCGVALQLVLYPDPTPHEPDVPNVDLRVINSNHDEAFQEFRKKHRRSARTTFGPDPYQELSLPPDLTWPATDLVYNWLARDLAAIGWLKDRHPFD